MPRLIDAKKYCDFLNRYPLEKAQSNFMTFYKDALRYTFECEVDAEPVRHGHWEYVGGNLYRCSVCHKGLADDDNILTGQENYCGVCGAKMDEEE